MGYVFKQQDSIATNLNRILSEEVSAALAALENPAEASADAIHSVRKRIKKIRALYRFVRRELKEKDFKQINTFYRSIGQQLSSLRDATVMIKTLDKLREAGPVNVSPRLLATLRKALLVQQAQAANAFFNDPNQLGGVIQAFQQAARRVKGLSKRHKGFRLIKPNLKAIYQRARKALKVATDKPSVDHLHELRKEVKTLWYHTRLLQPIWPGLLKAYEHEFGRLGELLGDDHDFGVLAGIIASDQLLIRSQQTKETLLNALQAQRTQLQAQIYPLANRLLSEKADEFVKRFQRHWKVWQSEANPLAVNQLQAA
ncbi:CHAD domain-containing protein [Spirosoma fluviale]|uniref:CHAD domain-containing protein n=1 Tax=Spirosoma fluviale TaxID=1597977 RepID=A0A286GU51_9BACT|nr:CHAD domain-containing protein [Spirosoma fluviale]SOD99051.1 CHAD domain-containing protein [Spirosoma fluviale]